MSFFRRYFSGGGWSSGSRDHDFRPTIRDTGRGSSRNVRYRGGTKEEEEPQTYDAIKERCLEQGCLWEDNDFPAEDSSLFHTEQPSAYPVEWLRPSEICDDPQLFIGGASRLDVNQGILGDCWLLAAVASLATNERLLHRVVPPDQPFDSDYAGIFRFQFWQYGRWVEIVVDDRLPTYNGKLVYMHSDEKNEFWTALLEKAFAKLNGCYENLSGGLTSEALTDFTGGVVERFNFKDGEPPNFNLLLQAHKKECLMGCSIDASPDEMEASLDNGLIIGHAYSITSVRMVTVETPRVTGLIPMIRIRNPWGNECEWKGTWSDKSEEWNFIPEEEREEMGLTFDHDGEFWMAYEDFHSNFQRLELCYLGPDSMAEDDEERTLWESSLVEGGWRRRVNAGGCMNYKNSFYTNPQCLVTITDPDEDDEEEMGTLIVGLMQKGRRKLRTHGKDNLTIGYAIYKVDSSDVGTLPKSFFDATRQVAMSPNFINMRENSGHHKLPPGHYCVVPCTFKPDEEAEYVLRVFSEKQNEAKELDAVTGKCEPETSNDETEDIPEDTDEDIQKREEAIDTFRELAGDDMEVDPYELQTILKTSYSFEFDFDGFSADLCRGLVAVRDSDFTGKLGFDEFQDLYNEIKLWEKIYKMYDTDGSGNFSSYELRAAFSKLGYRLSNATFNAIVMRYTDKDGSVHFDDFVACLIKLKTMFETYKDKDPDMEAEAAFPLDEFIQMTMYS